MEMRKKEEVVSEAAQVQLRTEDVARVYDFAAEVSRKFGTFIKAVVVFGSFARKAEAGDSDVDVLVIVDDSFAPLDQALLVAFQSEMNRLVSKYPKLHISPVSISQFWDSVRRGDPVTLSALRDGVPVADLGFFAPLKRLLIQGKIRPTQEAVNVTISRAFSNLNSYASTLNGALYSLYWATVEAAHAAVMCFDKIPGSPWEVAGLLRETMVNAKALTETDVKVYEELFETMKKLEKEELDMVKPADLEALHGKAVKFVAKIDAWVNAHSLKQTPKKPGESG
ncbi:MAG TPA: hypothetical protein ENN60_00840 [archaeon]|nr:hypothetical protein [archaeon]